MGRTHAKKPLSLAVLSLLLLAFLAGCGGAAAPQDKTAYAEDGGYTVEAEMTPQAAMDMATGAGAPTVSLPQDDRKVVLTAYVTLETTDFDTTCRKLEEALTTVGGYTSSTSINTDQALEHRSASFTMRVPAENYSGYLGSVGQAGNMTHRSESSEDVTEQYVDVEARLKSLRSKEKRLLERIDGSSNFANTSSLEEQLTEVQYEIERYEGYQRALDKQVTYSTVNITVQEVSRVTETAGDSYLSKLGHTFTQSWRTAGRVFQSLGLLLVSLVPLLLVLGAATLLVLFFVRKSRKREGHHPTPGTRHPLPGTAQSAPAAQAPAASVAAPAPTETSAQPEAVDTPAGDSSAAPEEEPSAMPGCPTQFPDPAHSDLALPDDNCPIDDDHATDVPNSGGKL